MNRLQQLVHDAGGVLHRRDLLAEGVTSRHLTKAVRHGILRRPRRGWYSTLPPDDPRFIAVSVGGRLTGAAALKLLGAWMWSSAPPITASVPRNAARLRRRRRVRVTHDPPMVQQRGSISVVDRRDALRCAVLELEFEDAVATWDWARRSPDFSADDLREVLDSLPSDARGIATWSDAEAQSFLESVGRVRFVADGHEVESQVAMSGGRSIDLVVDGVVAVELDGFEHHGHTFESDRVKDCAIAAEGRVPLRASLRMVQGSWESIAMAVRVSLDLHLPTKAQAQPVDVRQLDAARTPATARRHGAARRPGAVALVPAGSPRADRSHHHGERRWRCGRLAHDDLRLRHGVEGPDGRLTSSERETERQRFDGRGSAHAHSAAMSGRSVR